MEPKSEPEDTTTDLIKKKRKKLGRYTEYSKLVKADLEKWDFVLSLARKTHKRGKTYNQNLLLFCGCFFEPKPKESFAKKGIFPSNVKCKINQINKMLEKYGKIIPITKNEYSREKIFVSLKPIALLCRWLEDFDKRMELLDNPYFRALYFVPMNVFEPYCGFKSYRCEGKIPQDNKSSINWRETKLFIELEHIDSCLIFLRQKLELQKLKNSFYTDFGKPISKRRIDKVLNSIQFNYATESEKEKWAKQFTELMFEAVSKTMEEREMARAVNTNNKEWQEFLQKNFKV